MNPRLKRWAFAAAAGSGYLALRRRVTRGGFRIVTYHGVDTADHPVINFDRLQTSPDLFTLQLEALARAFRVVPLADAVRSWREQGVWPSGALAVTFDDGYRNNLEVAAPILKRLGVPATFFVTAGFVDGTARPWWYDVRQWVAGRNQAVEQARRVAADYEARLRPMDELTRGKALRAMDVDGGGPLPYPFLSAAQCRQLLDQGFDVQGHGGTHASFSGESAGRVEEEIRASAAFVRSLGREPWALAYPYGHVPADMAAAHRAMTANGFKAAFTTQTGSNGPAVDIWQLRRWDVHGGYSAQALLARVS